MMPHFPYHRSALLVCNCSLLIFVSISTLFIGRHSRAECATQSSPPPHKFVLQNGKHSKNSINEIMPAAYLVQIIDKHISKIRNDDSMVASSYASAPLPQVPSIPVVRYASDEKELELLSNELNIVEANLYKSSGSMILHTSNKTVSKHAHSNNNPSSIDSVIAMSNSYDQDHEDEESLSHVQTNHHQNDLGSVTSFEGNILGSKNQSKEENDRNYEEIGKEMMSLPTLTFLFAYQSAADRVRRHVPHAPQTANVTMTITPRTATPFRNNSNNKDDILDGSYGTTRAVPDHQLQLVKSKQQKDKDNPDGLVNKEMGRVSHSPSAYLQTTTSSSSRHPQFMPSFVDSVPLPLMPIRRESVSSISILHGPQVVVSRERVMINCACDTWDCVSNGQRTCKTYDMCYTQTLADRNGTSSLVRGCISGSTPLLCENRRPKIVPRWPVLKCCKVEMCNMPEKIISSHNLTPGSGYRRKDNAEDYAKIVSTEHPTTPKTYPVTYMSAITLVWNNTVYESEGHEDIPSKINSTALSIINEYASSDSNSAVTTVPVLKSGGKNATGGEQHIPLFLNTSPSSFMPMPTLRSVSTPSKYKPASGRLSPKKNANSLGTTATANANSGIDNGNDGMKLSVSQAETSRKKSIRHKSTKPGKSRYSSFQKQANDKESNERAITSVNLKKKLLATLIDDKTSVSTFSHRHLPKISPIATGFLVGGAIIILVISTIGFWILKKEQLQSRTLMPSGSGCSYDMALPDPQMFRSTNGYSESEQCEEPEEDQTSIQAPCLRAGGSEANTCPPHHSLLTTKLLSTAISVDAQTTADDGVSGAGAGVTPTSLVSTEAFVIHEFRCGET